MKYRKCLPWNGFICDLRVLVRKLACPFGQPTQVSKQVQLAATCDYLQVRLANALTFSANYFQRPTPESRYKWTWNTCFLTYFKNWGQLTNDYISATQTKPKIGSQTEHFSNPHTRLQLRGYSCKLKAKIDLFDSFRFTANLEKAGHKLEEKHKDF